MIERFQLEQKEEWREWVNKIPSIRFPMEWKVKVIPPFAGAMARFLVESEGKTISVYLDCHGALGAVDTPYWEIHPYEDDVYRCGMEEVEELITAIHHALKTHL